jgi:hypothetical protein
VATRTAAEEKGFTWTETYEGSGNTDGFITDINSTVGYIFNQHFSINIGGHFCSSAHLLQTLARLPFPEWGTPH